MFTLTGGLGINAPPTGATNHPSARSVDLGGCPMCGMSLVVCCRSRTRSSRSVLRAPLVARSAARYSANWPIRSRKSDRVDAEYLARVAQLDPTLLCALDHRSESGQCRLAIIRARDTFVRSRGRLIQHVRSAIKAIGQRVPSGTAECFHKRAVACLPDGLREALLPLIETIEQITTRIQEFDRKVQQLAEDRYPDTGALTQVCGVGSLTALAYILTLEDEGRFRRSRSVGAWLGLVPGQHDSGHSHPQWHITKEGDPYLRRLLVGSAQYILGPYAKDCDLRGYGLSIAARGGANAKKRAVVAVARKLAVCYIDSGAPAKCTRRFSTHSKSKRRHSSSRRTPKGTPKAAKEKAAAKEASEHVDAHSDRL